MHPACRLVSLWLGWQQPQPSHALAPVGMDLVGFLIILLISKLVFYAKTNNNNRQWWILGDLNMLMKRQIVQDCIKAVRDYHPHVEGYKQIKTLVAELNDTVTPRS